MKDKLRKARKSKKISGHELAKILGYKSPATYYKKENGTIPMTYEELKTICEYLEMTPEDIINIFFEF